MLPFPSRSSVRSGTVTDSNVVRSFAKNITKQDRDKQFEKMNFNDTFLAGKRSNTLTILPIESMAPRYRDQQPT